LQGCEEGRSGNEKTYENMRAGGGIAVAL